MLSWYQVFVLTVVFLSSCFSVLAVSILVLGVSSANAQTQASCQFVKFNRRFFVNYGHRILDPRGVNDNGTVVGDAYDDCVVDQSLGHNRGGIYRFLRQAARFQAL